jgi:tagatose 6-phosphate kinase
VGVLRSAGARDVVVSDGADGLLVFPLHGRPLRAWLPTPLAGNPTGAGDALGAALASGLEAGDPWPVVARRAVAWSAAAVRQPVAGEVDPDDAIDLESQVRMEETDDAVPA